jgi:hypothetical protein
MKKSKQERKQNFPKVLYNFTTINYIDIIIKLLDIGISHQRKTRVTTIEEGNNCHHGQMDIARRRKIKGVEEERKKEVRLTSFKRSKRPIRPNQENTSSNVFLTQMRIDMATQESQNS